MDFYTDHGSFLIRLFGQSNNIELPEFVKTAEYDSEERISSLPSLSFADKINRKFPLHTPANVYVSAAYYYGKTAAQDPQIIDGIKKAALLFGITKEIQEAIDLATTSKTETKVATPFTGWSIEVGEYVRSGVTAKQLEYVAEEFLGKFAAYDFSDREEIASAVVEVADQIGASISNDIRSLAKIGSCNRQLLKAAIDQRALFLADDRNKTAMSLLLSESFGTEGNPSDDEMTKLAEILNDFDVQYGLNKRYGRGVIEPHLAIWSDHSKKASVVVIGTKTWEFPEIEKSLSDVFEFVTGRKIATVNAEALAGLSETEASDLNAILSK
jgi:hypothetical protein